VTTAPISPGSAAAAIIDAIGLRMLEAVETGQLPSPIAPAPPVGEAPSRPTAVETALQTAVSRQGGLAPLLADLAIAVQTPTVPAAIRDAAARVLALQPSLAQAPTGADLKQALAQSGLMLEARLAADGTPPPADLKAALLVLRQALQASTTPSAQPGPAQPPPPPPYRGGPVRAQPAVAPTLPDDPTAEIIAQHLIPATEAALARQTLLQLTSALPQAPGAAPTAQWLFEIPFVTAQGSSVAQFEIGHEDDSAGSKASGGDAPTWRARFSLDLDPMGPVHARISLSGGHARVTLWAEKAITAVKLSAQHDQLSVALSGDDLVATIVVLPGAPNAPAPSSGKFVDRAL
jgi:hypothetical protein